MPELPEVETIVRDLICLQGKTISEIVELRPNTVINKTQLDLTEKIGTIKSIERRGKYLLFVLDSCLMIIHLRMTGKLIYPADKNSIGKHTRAYLLLTNGEIVIFNDIRTFGKIELIGLDDKHNTMATLGPEPLTEGFDKAYLSNICSSKNTNIKTILMDQTIVAGLGNIYVLESLYRCRISPETMAKVMTARQIDKLVKEIKIVLLKAIECNGTSISDYRRIDDKKGEFQNFLQIYGKKLCPLDHPVKRIKQGGRSTYFCPECQK